MTQIREKKAILPRDYRIILPKIEVLVVGC
jgi:hypothetical protein